MNKRYYEHTLSTTREFIEYLQSNLKFKMYETDDLVKL